MLSARDPLLPLSPEEARMVRTVADELADDGAVGVFRSFGSVLPGKARVIAVRGLLDVEVLCRPTGLEETAIGIEAFPGPEGRETLRLAMCETSWDSPGHWPRQRSATATIGRGEWVTDGFRTVLEHAGVQPTSAGRWPGLRSRMVGRDSSEPTRDDLALMSLLLPLMNRVGRDLGRERAIRAALGKPPSPTAWLTVTLAPCEAAGWADSARPYALSWSERDWSQPTAPYSLTPEQVGAAARLREEADSGWLRSPLIVYGFYADTVVTDGRDAPVNPYMTALLTADAGEAIKLHLSRGGAPSPSDQVDFMLNTLRRTRRLPSQLLVFQAEMADVVSQLAWAIGSRLVRRVSLPVALRFHRAFLRGSSGIGDGPMCVIT